MVFGFHSFGVSEKDVFQNSTLFDSMTIVENVALPLDGRFGLHPALGDPHADWNAKRLAIVHAIGSRDSTRSHFDAQDYMESGTPGRKSTEDGWMNRHLEARPDPEASALRAVLEAHGDPDRLTDLLAGRARAKRIVRVQRDAVGAAVGDPDRERDQLLLRCRQRRIGHRRTVQVAEPPHLIGQQLVQLPVPGAQLAPSGRRVVRVHRSSFHRAVLDAIRTERRADG